MGAADEIAASARTPMGAALADYVNTLSLDQKITFDLYARLVLPADGFVFWVKAVLLTPTALLNVSAINSFAFNQGETVKTPAKQIMAQGSLHYATEARQEESVTYSVNRVVFTSLQEVQDLNETGPEFLYIASFDGIRFAFSGRGSFYQQADLWHYSGAAYSLQDSQIIDDPRLFNSRQLIVSNSLPSWLALNSYAPPWPVPLPMPKLNLFPSYLSPNNQTPIFGTIHIEPEGTTALQSAPSYDANYSSSLLASDKVTVTLYGTNNDLAQTFISCVQQYSLDTDHFGLMSMPVVLDDKVPQVELSALAMKKRIKFEISYNQSAQRALPRQLINSAIVSHNPQRGPALPTVNVPTNVFI